MRKTLAVLVLMTSSLLLLQAPAWAHKLYKIKQGSFVALSDCDDNKILISSRKDAPFQSWTKQPGTTTFQNKTVSKFLLDERLSENVKFNPAKLQAKCKGDDMDIDRTTLLGTGVPKTSLPFTGRPLVPQLLLGISLLLVGSLLVTLTVHPSLAVGLGRRRPRPTTPS